MPSRPKRKSKPTNASTVDVSPSDAVVQTDGESDLEPPKKRQKKAKGTAAKRKVNVADKARLLPSLNAMPLDIFYEVRVLESMLRPSSTHSLQICETLEPLDVLHLSWTSIYIHNTLMDKNATSALWKKSRSLIVGLPECPNDLNEAQYAHLMFGKDCYVRPLSRDGRRFCFFFFNNMMSSVALRSLGICTPFGPVDFERAHHV